MNPNHQRKNKVQAGNFKDELKECTNCQKKIADVSRHLKNGNCTDLLENQQTDKNLGDSIEEEKMLTLRNQAWIDQNLLSVKDVSESFKRLQVHL